MERSTAIRASTILNRIQEEEMRIATIESTLSDNRTCSMVYMRKQLEWEVNNIPEVLVTQLLDIIKSYRKENAIRLGKELLSL